MLHMIGETDLEPLALDDLAEWRPSVLGGSEHRCARGSTSGLFTRCYLQVLGSQGHSGSVVSRRSPSNWAAEWSGRVHEWHPLTALPVHPISKGVPNSTPERRIWGCLVMSCWKAVAEQILPIRLSSPMRWKTPYTAQRAGLSFVNAGHAVLIATDSARRCPPPICRGCPTPVRERHGPRRRRHRCRARCPSRRSH
jgi:hypothetical protein